MAINLTKKERATMLLHGMCAAYDRVLAERADLPAEHSGWVEDPNEIIVRIDSLLDGVLKYADGDPGPWF